MSGGLLQLISHENSRIDRGSQEHSRSLYGKVHTTEIKIVDFVKNVATIPKFCDFVGEVHLKVVIPAASGQPAASPDPFSLFDAVELTVNDRVVEEVSVQWMHALDNGNVMQEPIVEEAQDSTVIIYPLSFALTQAWLPNLKMMESLAKIELKGCVLPADAVRQLIVTAIYLPTNTRREAYFAPLRPDTVLWIRNTQVKKGVEGEVDIEVSGEEALRELVVFVSSHAPTAQPLTSLNCVSGGTRRHDTSDPVYYQKVVPRALYHIDNKRPMYYITLDPTPLADTCTSLLYTKSLQSPTYVHLHLAPGKHDVYILTRVLRRVSFTNNGCVFNGISK